MLVYYSIGVGVGFLYDHAVLPCLKQGHPGVFFFFGESRYHKAGVAVSFRYELTGNICNRRTRKLHV